MQWGWADAPFSLAEARERANAFAVRLDNIVKIEELLQLKQH
jgi:hypothetical protein